MRPARPFTAALTLGLVAALAACAADEGEVTPSDDGDTLVIYSGRNENLVAPVLEQLEEAVGVPVQVRYASTSELAAQLLEEGAASEADLFFGQDAGALGALAKADMLTPLDEAVTGLVPDRYRDPEGRWVATSGRARVLAYDPAQVPEIEDLTGVDQLLEPEYRGRVGYAPSNASFHAFVTALRLDRGEDGARAWLEAFAANDPVGYENNNAILDAVDGGQVALGLINHYYWHQKVAELGEDAVDARIHHLDPADPGALVNVAGAAVLAGTDNRTAASEAVAFLLSEPTQQYFADATAEYPVVEGITSTTFDLPPLQDQGTSEVDLGDLDSLEETLTLLDEVGLT